MNLKRLLVAMIASALMACSSETKKTIDPIAKNIDYNSLRSTNSQKPALSNPSNGTVVLNPEHGKPGHRCDIAVGAPLNTGTPKATVTTTKATVTPPEAIQASSKEGTNPPHGQANHRCDIAVGAPLNSKSSQPKVTQVNQAPVAVTAKGMNPPHGQPNHRCDIAVGAPLDSKPTLVTKKIDSNSQ